MESRPDPLDGAINEIKRLISQGRDDDDIAVIDKLDAIIIAANNGKNLYFAHCSQRIDGLA